MGQKAPLAYRMCPQNLQEYIGQENILAEGKLLYRLIKADKLSSIILWGPPGSGKSALAKVIASTTNNRFERLNAVTSGVSDIKSIVNDTNNKFLNPNGKVLLFIDEIHRFNKAQQDALLPCVENGTVILIGATTENPYFEVNKALISRSTVFKLQPLGKQDIIKIVRNALKDKERGLGNIKVDITGETLEILAQMSNGDARTALNAVELAVLTTSVASDGSVKLNKEILQECLQQKNVTYDKNADGHYDNISAFIKSMRGSDPDAALFYLARAIYAGEDPMFLARRIVMCAAEDVGIANPQAFINATAAAQAVHMIGMPEAKIILAQAAVTVAVSPKSNSSYVGINKALDDIKNRDTGEVPLHLRNAVFRELDKQHGYGNDYKYAHDYEGNYVQQQYLPDKMLGTIYYKPTMNGYEKEVKERLNKLK